MVTRRKRKAVDDNALSVNVETITPEMATTYLKSNVHNRGVRKRVVEKYARDIASGHWQLNGDTVRFSDEGNLIDGQHRLLAIVKAGTPATCIVVRGLKESVMSTIDQGAKRSGADLLKLNGEGSASTLASSLRTLFNLDSHTESVDESFTSDEMMQMLEKYPNVRHWITRCHYNKTGNRSALSAICTKAEKKYSKTKVMAFVDAISTGEGLSRTDPAYVMRETVIQWRLATHKGTRRSRRAWIALYLACLGAHCRDEKMKSFTYVHADPLPAL